MQGGSRLGSILMSQGIAYFSLTAIAYLIVAVLCLLQLSSLMSAIGAVPSSAIAVIASTRLYIDLAEAARCVNSSTHGSNSQNPDQGSGKMALSFGRSKFGGSKTPVKQNSNLSSSFGSFKNGENGDSPSDLESQSSGDKSNEHSLQKSSHSAGMEPILIRHPYAYAASGLPVFSSQTSPRFAITQDLNFNNASVVTSGQKLAIAVERSYEVRSEVIPCDVNFVAESDARRSEGCSGLRRQSG